MSSRSETAFAKLNLALHVRRRRAAGHHEIETIFAFCEDGDGLAIEKLDQPSCDVIVSGPFGGEIGKGNLVTAAWAAMRDAAAIDGGARFMLDKRLPVAAGLGGGSADAAAALRLMTRQWRVDPGIAQGIAPQIGSDVPACLLSRPSRGSGAGDEIEPADLNLTGTPVLLVNPRLSLSTADVFARWDGNDRGPLDSWRDGRNDLEPAAISLVPAIADVLEWLRARPGADVTRMSGSGATCFALFASESARDAAATRVPSGWWQLATHLR